MDSLVEPNVVKHTVLDKVFAEHIDCIGRRFCYVVCIGKFSFLSREDVVSVCFECLCSLERI